MMQAEAGITQGVDLKCYRPGLTKKDDNRASDDPRNFIFWVGLISLRLLEGRKPHEKDASMRRIHAHDRESKEIHASHSQEAEDV